MDIALARPDITDREIDAVVGVLKTPNLALGPKLKEFEAAFARYCGTRHAVAVSSGTAGLHLLMQASGIAEGDEVITTPFSFVASANCILYVGAKPVFVDIDPHTWNIDARGVADSVTERTKAIVPVDVFGQPASYEPILEVARRHGLRVIEDACEALGARYRDRAAGAIGDAGVFGFYPNKQITTGEGGMIVTDDDDLADLCRSMRNQGRDTTDGMRDAGGSSTVGGGRYGGWLVHARLGYNYRLSEMNCALGLAQLSRIESILATRARVAGWYLEEFSGDARIVTQRILPETRMSWFVFVVRLSDAYSAADRDRILRGLRDRRIGCSNYFAPIHLQAYMADRFGFRRGDFPECERVADRTLALPFHKELTREIVAKICEVVRSML